MKVAFRVDAGIAMGGGHLSRCLTIANALILSGVSKCFFILKSHQGSFASTIQRCGFEFEVLPLEFQPDYKTSDYGQWVGGSILNDGQLSLSWLKKKGFTDKDWLIVDHYGLDYKFEELIAKSGINIGVIDDLVNRQHSCQFLIDQTCGRKDIEYKKLVSSDTYLMTGQRFCMLRPEFLKIRSLSLLKRSAFQDIKCIFINFGSTDPTNVTSRIISTLSQVKLHPEMRIVVAVGRNTPHLLEIQNCISTYPGEINLIVDAINMSELMYQADLAIGAAGATTWERCTLGLPAIIIKTAENQNTVIKRIIEFGVAVLHDLDTENQPVELLKHLSYIQENYLYMSEKCSDLVQGDGVNKVVDRILRCTTK